MDGIESGSRTTLSVTPPVTFTPSAQEELIHAQEWYENKVSGLGRRFRAAVDDLIERIIAIPTFFRLSIKTFTAVCCGVFPML
jgi:hypothetical protein